MAINNEIAYNDDCTGNFKIHTIDNSKVKNPINKMMVTLMNFNSHIILQEVEKKYLIFFTKKYYIPLLREFTFTETKDGIVKTETQFVSLGSQDLKSCNTILKQVTEDYKPYLREKRLSEILSK